MTTFPNGVFGKVREYVDGLGLGKISPADLWRM